MKYVCPTRTLQAITIEKMMIERFTRQNYMVAATGRVTQKAALPPCERYTAFRAKSRTTVAAKIMDPIRELFLSS
jgi:hypothetical protein